MVIISDGVQYCGGYDCTLIGFISTAVCSLRVAFETPPLKFFLVKDVTDVADKLCVSCLN